MSKYSILILFFVVFLFSCTNKSKERAISSTGKLNAISVVIDDQLWNGIVGDSIRNKFASPVEGLPTEEPRFDINQFPTHLMEGFVTKSRIIIVVKKGTKNSFEIKKNQYATPQNVIHISGRTLTDLVNIIEQRTPQIIQIFEASELKEQQRLLKVPLQNIDFIQKQFNLTLQIPKPYSYIFKQEDFVWLKKEYSTGSTSIILTQLPLKDIKTNADLLEQFIRIHDSLGALYIKSSDATSKMYIDRSFPLYVSKTTLNGKSTYEIKGTWRLKNSFMFGPFVNYLIWDNKKNRIIFLEGFCYMPSKDRRDFMQELETILKGVTIH